MPEQKAPEDMPEKPVQAHEAVSTAEENYEDDAEANEYYAAAAADRALIRTLVNFVGMSLESEAPDRKRVKLARDWALEAAYARIGRICKSDQFHDPKYSDDPADYLAGEEEEV